MARAEWGFVAAYATIIAALIAQVALAINYRTLGLLSPIGILGLSWLQAGVIFATYLYGRYKPIVIFMLISLASILPLLVAFLFSVELPPHAGVAE